MKRFATISSDSDGTFGSNNTSKNSSAIHTTNNTTKENSALDSPKTHNLTIYPNYTEDTTKESPLLSASFPMNDLTYGRRESTPTPFQEYQQPRMANIMPFWQPPPRQCVSNTMLGTYAIMRGSQDKRDHTALRYGPMHDALFLHDRWHPAAGILARLPEEWKNDTTDLLYGHPPGRAFFWDPIAPFSLSQPCPWSQPPPVNNRGRRGESLGEWNNVDSPRFRPSHYTGSDAFANYHYLKVNGCWVDPESEGEIADAIAGRTSPSKLPHVPIGASGPRIMGPQELDQFYSNFVDGSDDGDGEGDPRMLRITPHTFARWAEGAAKGDTYVEAGNIPQEKWPRHEHEPFDPREQDRYIGCRQLPQYDEITGEAYSGIYDAPSSPSPLFSAEGVNMENRPAHFGYMSPQVDRQLERAAFGPKNALQRTREWVTSTDHGSPLKVFTSEGARREFANSENSNEADEDYEEIKHRITALQDATQHTLKYSACQWAEVREIHDEKGKLHKEISIMNSHIRRFAPPTSSPTPDLKFTVPSPVIYQSEPYSSRFPAPKAGKVNGPYHRQLEEIQIDTLVAIERAQIISTNADVQAQPILDAIQQLSGIHQDLKEQLHIETSEEIQTLLPGMRIAEPRVRLEQHAVEVDVDTYDAEAEFSYPVEQTNETNDDGDDAESEYSYEAEYQEHFAKLFANH